MTERFPDGVIASIAAAYAGRPDVSQDDIIAFVARLRQEFGADASDGEGAGKPAPAPASAAADPALPIDKAVTRDRVFCLCCGKGFKMLKRHLGAEHGLTEAEYRALFSLPEEMPLVAPSYSSRKADYAKQVGFGRYDRARAAERVEDDETAV
jgi:predicted transcriptional regulator